MNIRDINEKHAKCYYSVSSLDIRNTRKAHRNLQQIHLGFVDYPRHELVRDLLLTQEKTVPR